MEVLNAGEELERQIREDALGKSRQIMESAEKDCMEIMRELEKRCGEERARMEAECEAKIARMREELNAALPLDFKRARLSYMEETLKEKLDGIFTSLSKKESLSILSSIISRVAHVFEGKKVRVFTDMTSLDVENMLKEAIKDISILSVQPMDRARKVESVKRSSVKGSALPGILLETEDGKIRYRGTFAELREMLLEEYREELATALFGLAERVTDGSAT
jgi:vacuolar-type H+-ATPase subunit E/Vma4